MAGIFTGGAYPRSHLPSIEGAELGIVCIVKNESAYIGEWLQFHILQGATDFFIYDNGSTDDTLEVARKYSAGADCTIIPWRTFAIADEHPFSIQSLAYAHALCNFGPHLRRMAFIDIDEFLFSPSGAQLPAVLTELEHLPSIAVPWLNFGPNGHQTRPQGLVIENYTECAPHPLLAAQRSLFDTSPSSTHCRWLRWLLIFSRFANMAPSLSTRRDG